MYGRLEIFKLQGEGMAKKNKVKKISTCFVGDFVAWQKQGHSCPKNANCAIN